MVSEVNLLLVIIHPVLSLINLQLPWNFLVGPRYMDPYDISFMVLVGGSSLLFSSYVPNYTLQCLEYSKVQSFIMILGE